MFLLVIRNQLHKQFFHQNQFKSVQGLGRGTILKVGAQS